MYWRLTSALWVPKQEDPAEPAWTSDLQKPWDHNFVLSDYILGVSLVAQLIKNLPAM